MTRPTIATKMVVPSRRPALVDRPRLIERVRRGSRSRLTLVSAPAGFGKTTLLSAWLAENGAAGQRRVAWLSLDAGDRDPAVFWTYLATALRSAVPEVGSQTLELTAVDPLPIELVVTTLLNQLAAAEGEIWLVLDDYHLVDGSDIGTGMTRLLDNLPAHVHLVISTRADPDLALARWRVRRELVEIRAADLRFTVEEATDYLTQVAGLDLAGSAVAALEQRTEGWIAALQLAALSLQGRGDVAAFIDRFTGTDRFVVDYLVEEVLAHQPPDVRDFLLQTAVLDELTGPLCDALTGRRDGERTLVALERANLFLVPLDDRREWFRYHHLFADVLRARLLSERPDQVTRLHRQASNWFDQQDRPEDAIRHALAVGEVNRAADLIERALPALRRNRQDRQLRDWLTALPDETVRARPVLSVLVGHLLLASGDLAAVQARLDDAERALTTGTAGHGGSAELRTLPATIAVFRASVAQARGDEPATAAHARRALALAGPDNHLARGAAAGFLGLAAWARGDVRSALSTFEQAVTSLHAAGAVVDELSGTVILADLWSAAGRPGRARELYRDALRDAAAHRPAAARAEAEMLVGLSEIDCTAGDVTSAQQQLELADELSRGRPTTESRYRWFVARARVADATGAPAEALQLLTQAQRLYQPGYFPAVRPIPAIQARVRIRAGDLGPVMQWAQQPAVADADEDAYLHAYQHLTVVRLRLAQARAGAAGALDGTAERLERMAQAAQAAGRDGDLLEIHLLQALVRQARGDRPGAARALARAWAAAPEPDEYARLFLDEGEPVFDLLRDAATQTELAGPARRLLELGADPGRPPAPGTAGPLAVELSPREREVLRRLDSELTGPEIARTLFVSHNTLRTHTKHIFTKLDVTSRRAAVRRARDLGLL